MKPKDYPYQEKGARRAPDHKEALRFAEASQHEGGQREMPAEAQKFSARFAAAVTHYPGTPELPNWVRALVEKKVPVEALVKTLHDRTLRAPSEENQELALVLANEIARMKGGTELLKEHTTRELLDRLSGTERREGGAV